MDRIEACLQAYLDQLFKDSTRSDQKGISLNFPGDTQPHYYDLFGEFGVIDNFPHGLISFLLALDFLKVVIRENQLEVNDADLLQGAVDLSKSLINGAIGPQKAVFTELKQIRSIASLLYESISNASAENDA